MIGKGADLELQGMMGKREGEAASKGGWVVVPNVIAVTKLSKVRKMLKVT